ncbi:hypothetical protein G7054_g10791 [Neopestalotiopsis clavispora]|nr:hypothetical protein G7054_g10791 [Neopestalotiopsis clavispora]
MKFQLLFATFVALVVAQDGLPDCAKNCVTQFTTGDNIGGCPQINAQCICSQQSFISGIACCLADVCSAADQQAAVDYAVKFCGSFGVTVPSAVSCTSTATATGTSTADSSSTGSVTSTGTAGSVTTTATTGTAASATAASTTSQNAGSSGSSGSVGIVGGLAAAVLALL